MTRAWISGVLAVFLAHLAWFGLVVAESYVDGFMPFIVGLLLVVLNVAGVAAYLTARRAPHHRLLLALTMAPLTAALGTASNLLFAQLGVRVDISGFYNNAGLFTSLLLYGALVSVVGGGLGMWRGRKAHVVDAPIAAVPVVPENLPEVSVAPVEVADDLPQIRSD
jgi:hypothetical protein